MMLSLIIPGPQSITSAHFDIFLALLLVELLQLCTRVWSHLMRPCTKDCGISRSVCYFFRRFTIFPEYGIVASCITKGFKGCPAFGPNTKSRKSKVLSKNVYDNQHQKWLPLDHPFCSNLAFNGTVEEGVAPVRLRIEEIIFLEGNVRPLLRTKRPPKEMT